LNGIEHGVFLKAKWGTAERTTAGRE